MKSLLVPTSYWMMSWAGIPVTRNWLIWTLIFLPTLPRPGRLVKGVLSWPC